MRGPRAVLDRLFSQERAVANARAACTVLAQQSLEREETLLYLEKVARARAAHPA